MAVVANLNPCEYGLLIRAMLITYHSVIFVVSKVLISIPGLYPALSVAIGPHIRAQASSDITTLTPLNVFVLAAANPAMVKSTTFRAAVEKPMRMIEESLQCPFLFSVSHLNSSI